MWRSNLFVRIFATLISLIGIFSVAVYVFTVPWIERRAYEIELNASRTILDNVFEVVSRIDGGLETQRALTLEVYKREMKTATDLAAAYLTFMFNKIALGEVSEDEGRRLAFEGVRAMRYGEQSHNYIWVTDYTSRLLSHPDPVFQGQIAAQELDEKGRPVLPRIIDVAREKGEGFHIYPWRKPGEPTASGKISYFKNMPQYGLVLGAGAFMDDIGVELARRKTQAIEELRQLLRSTRIARTGYVYIFDGAENMIIHPNRNIEGAAFSERRNPRSQQPIARELKRAAEEGKPWTYRWDKPDDPDNYAYDKISWVRHFQGFDWYIASSVYEEELRRSAVELTQRIQIIAGLVILFATVFSYIAARRLSQPLRRLADVAAEVQAGNLGVESHIRRRDEIGVLAAAFDGMIRRLRVAIDTLDQRVRERTAALQEAEARQRLILDAIPASIAYLDRSERIRFANRLWAEQVRRSKDELIGLAVRDVMPSRAYAACAPHLRRTWEGRDASFEYAYVDAEGRRRITKNVMLPERSHSDAGSVIGLFVLSLDVTDERDAARQLMEAQRLNAVGQLAGGLAHDFNNLLSIIIGNLSGAREKFAATPGLDAYLEPALRAGRRGADITGRLLAFSRRHPQRPQAVEATALAQSAIALLRRSTPDSVCVVAPPADAPLCWAFVDEGQLENALVNLLLNARDAMPEGGCVQVTAAAETVTTPLTFDQPVPPGDYVRLTVRDEGVGFSPEAAARAFEPFFTTKTFGSGLGLSMVYGFVKQSGGFIALESEPGGGATVTMLLPAADPPAELGRIAAARLDVLPAPWRGRLALAVEDDDDVRRVMVDHLMGLGLSVIEAASGDEAVALIEGLEELALVVSDIVMPGASGVELARRLATTRPGLRVVLVSGYSFEDGEELADLTILRKPWDKPDLAAAILRAEPPKVDSRG